MNRKGELRAKSLVYMLFQSWSQTSTAILNNIPYLIVMRSKNIYTYILIYIMSGTRQNIPDMLLFPSRFLPNMKGIFRLQLKTRILSNSKWIVKRQIKQLHYLVLRYTQS